MKITIRDKKLRAAVDDEALLKRRYGAEMAQKIKVRVGSLVAAKSLADFWPPMSPSERCHELKGDLAGIFSMDLKHPYRLLLRPSDALNAKADMNEQQRWQRIEAIEIVDIQNTHG